MEGPETGRRQINLGCSAFRDEWRSLPGSACRSKSFESFLVFRNSFEDSQEAEVQAPEQPAEAAVTGASMERRPECGPSTTMRCSEWAWPPGTSMPSPAAAHTVCRRARPQSEREHAAWIYLPTGECIAHREFRPGAKRPGRAASVLTRQGPPPPRPAPHPGVTGQRRLAGLTRRPHPRRDRAAQFWDHAGKGCGKWMPFALFSIFPHGGTFGIHWEVTGPRNSFGSRRGGAEFPYEGWRFNPK